MVLNACKESKLNGQTIGDQAIDEGCQLVNNSEPSETRETNNGL